MVKPAGGREYYRKAGLRPILVYVPKATHASLMKEAKTERRSLQDQVRLILEKHTGAK